MLDFPEELFANLSLLMILQLDGYHEEANPEGTEDIPRLQPKALVAQRGMGSPLRKRMSKKVSFEEFCQSFALSLPFTPIFPPPWLR
jgi:hypothetical protein